MAYKRKTKDVVCKKCGRPNRIPRYGRLSSFVCAKRVSSDERCYGEFRLKK